MIKKIVNLNLLKQKIKKFKLNNKKIILCHGVFDLLHAGHIMHFQESKNLGDILIVSLTPDKYVLKGPNRPIMNLKERMEVISQLECVDYVVENFKPDAATIINDIRPDIYSKGSDYKKDKDDYTGKIIDEKKSIQKVGGKIYFTKSRLFSSSKIINDLSINLNDKQKQYLKLTKSKISSSNISFEKNIEDLKELKVLIIGEAIIDKYIFCEALGKSGKEPMLVMRDLESQKFLGGTLAIAKNISSFCKKVSVLTYLGSEKSEIKFMKKNLPKNVELNYVIKENSPSILKTRYIEQINSTKLFGVYSIGDDLISKKTEKHLLNKLKKNIKKFDLVIVSDYGHGLITDKLRAYIMKNSKFLSVNAQLNAANIGYHTIAKYKNSDLLIINENELRHEMRDKENNLDTLMMNLTKKIKTRFLVVTSGKDGSKILNTKNKNIINCPAFTHVAKDKVGAGDTFLSILSLCIKKNMVLELSMLISSLGAAENVKNIANSKYVSNIEMKKFLKSYLK